MRKAWIPKEYLLTRIGFTVMETDNELLGLFNFHQDESAFERLIQKHAPMVWQVCQSFLWNRADCEDAVQAVFLLLAKKSNSLSKHSSLGGWLHRTSVNVSLNYRRKIHRRREVEFDTDLNPMNCNEPWESITQAQQCEQLHLELTRLPERYRNAIILCHLDGMTRSEAAESLETTTGAIKAALARGKRMLRQRLLKQGIALSTALTVFSQSRAFACESIATSKISASNLTVTSTGTQINTASSTVNVAGPLQAISSMPVAVFHAGIATMIGLTTIASFAALPSNSVNSSQTHQDLILHTEITGSEATNITIDPSEATQESEVESSSSPIQNQQNDITETARSKILDLQIRLAEAKSRYGDQHPEIVSLKRQLKAIESTLKSDERKRLQLELMTLSRKLGPSHPVILSLAERIKALDQPTETPAKKDLSELNSLFAELREKFGDSHPKVNELKQKIADEYLNSKAKTPGHDTPDSWSLLNPGKPQVQNRVEFMEEELRVLRGRYTDNHPNVVGLRRALANERYEAIEDVRQVLRFAPRQPGAEYDSPKEFDSLRVTQLSDCSELVDKQGKTYRRFIDSNGDKKFDIWIYFKDGRETYRDVDKNYDSLVDEFHYIVGDTLIISHDKNQDGKIDSTTRQRVSDLHR